MEKLMDTDPYNRAMPRKMIGQDMFGDTYPTCSTTCQDQKNCDDCPIQEAFARLRQYEQTELTPEQIQELKERDTAKAPMYEGDGYSDEEMVYDIWICPNCGTKYEVDYDDYDFCPNCGQRILRQEN